MKIGVYYPPDNEEHRTVLEAFEAGIPYPTSVLSENRLEELAYIDCAVVFGIGKKNVPCSWARGKILAEMTRLGKPVIVLEKGYIKRDIYYAAGFDGLNGRADFKNENSPSDRWKSLGVTLERPKKYGTHILLCGQVPTDASVQHTDHVHWLQSTVVLIRGYTSAPIVFRPHPLALQRTPHVPYTLWSTRSLKDDLRDCLAVVTFNSNTGVNATVQGFNTFAMDVGSMVWNVALHDLAFLRYDDLPQVEGREQWSHDLAYCQWTCDEMRKGQAFKHLFKELL